MPRASKSKSTSKPTRPVHPIEDSAKKRGYGSKRAAQTAYATVSKPDPAAKKTAGDKNGGGRGRKRSSPSAKGVRGRSTSRAL